MTARFLRTSVVALSLLLGGTGMTARAQELNAKVTINHNQVQGTDASIFDELTQTLTQFVNERQWTNLQFQRNERINCNFNITVTKYDNSKHLYVQGCHTGHASRI